MTIVLSRKPTYAGLPFRFEAGTPNIAGNIAIGTAVDFMEKVGRSNIAAHEHAFWNMHNVSFGNRRLKVYGEKANRAGVVSFNLSGIGIASDVGMILDKLGIAVRTGHHCTQPIMEYFGVAGTVRASFAVYNTFEEIDILTEGVKKKLKKCWHKTRR